MVPMKETCKFQIGDAVYATPDSGMANHRKGYVVGLGVDARFVKVKLEGKKTSEYYPVECWERG